MCCLPITACVTRSIAGGLMTAITRWISALAVVLVWLFVGAKAGRELVSVYDRFVNVRPSSLNLEMGSPLAWALAVALLLGCVIAWRIVRAGPLDEEARAQRSSLSVWPGWPICIAGIVLAGAALMAGGLPPDAVLHLSISSLDDYTFIAFPMILAAAAGATGGRGNEAAAFLAAPTLLLVSVALIGETSIARASALLVVWVALAAVFAVLAAVTGRELLMWLAIGFVALTVMALPVATGFLTPVEALAAICVLAVGNGLLLYGLVGGAFPRRVFTVGAVEILAISTVWVFAALITLALRRYATLEAVHELVMTLSPALAGAVAVASMLVASVLLTPVVAAILVVHIFAPVFASLAPLGLLLTLTGIAAMCLRAIDGKSGAEATTRLRLSPTAGLAAAVALLAVAGLATLVWDSIASMPG